jgi:hypothetical protein
LFASGGLHALGVATPVRDTVVGIVRARERRMPASGSRRLKQIPRRGPGVHHDRLRGS